MTTSKMDKRNNSKTLVIIILVLLVIAILVGIVIAIVTMISKNRVSVKDINSANIGDTILFGSYEQDNDTEDGAEDIEWIVLEKENDRILVISKYGLDYQSFNSAYEDTEWGTCTLRTWLNVTFFNDAFNSDERALVQSTTVTTSERYDINKYDTTDSVFLLSIDEANGYFKSNRTRQCQATEYTKAKMPAVSRYGNCRWWLRSPGPLRSVAFVEEDGGVLAGGMTIDDLLVVRPALWIILEH